MQQRLIASGLVFAVGFGIGLGATYTLLSRAPESGQPGGDAAAAPVPPAAMMAPGADDDLDDEALGANGVEPTADGPVALDPNPEQPAAVEPKPAAAEPKPAAAEPKPAAAEPKPAAVEPEPAAVEPEPAAVEPAKPTVAATPEPTAPEAPTEPDAAPTADPPSAKPANWWEGLAGATCEVDLGRARALTIRKGSIKDGQVADWKKNFGGNPRIGLLSATEKNVVTVHGVAVNELGTPIAAEVSFDRKGTVTRGVIALHTQGLKVNLRRVSE